MNTIRPFFLLSGVSLALLLGCSNNSGPDTMAKISVTVLKAEDSTSLVNANILLYNMNTNSPIARGFSDNHGEFSFSVPPGKYGLYISAMGRIPVPANKGKPLPFQVEIGSPYTTKTFMSKDDAAIGSGGISGIASISGSTAQAGILIVATSLNPSTSAASTTTGPDGFFIFYNLPPGSYRLQGYQQGLVQDTIPLHVSVRSDSVTPNISIHFNATSGRTLQGKISFLASANSVVDITLVNPSTRDAIPGLTVYNDGSNNFILRGIPPGEYIAWASYRNDGYIMDPDRIQKFGLPRVYLQLRDSTIDFDVTDAISVVGPSNSADSLYPAEVNSLTPTFTWLKYPSAKEYILEVFDARGNRMWGGADSTGKILHTQVTTESARYNFDTSAKQALKNGGVYTWKVSADDDAAANIQGLISSSEDLRGIFQVKLP